MIGDILFPKTLNNQQSINQYSKRGRPNSNSQSRFVRKTYSPKVGYSMPTSNLDHQTKDTMVQKYDLEDRLVDFSSKVIQLVESLPATRSASYIANQIIRCGI